jgi:hypothetical protein
LSKKEVVLFREKKRLFLLLFLSHITIYDSDEEMPEEEEKVIDPKLLIDSGYISDCSELRNYSQQNESAINSHDFDDDFVNPLKFSSDHEEIMQCQENCSTSGIGSEDGDGGSLEMMPTTTEKFEYSYQTIDRVKNFWAGPSHWKFLAPKSFPKEKKEKHSKKRFKFAAEITLENISVSYDKTEQLLFKTSGKMKLMTMKDSKKSNQLIDCSVPGDVMDQFFMCPELNVKKPICHTLMPIPSQIGDDDDDDEPNYDSYFQEEGELENRQPPLHVHALENEPMTFKTINFANFKKKVINMRLVKETTSSVVESECLLKDEPTNFSTVYEKSAKLLFGRNENASVAIIFQAILHNANDGKIELAARFNNLSDFDIKLSE